MPPPEEKARPTIDRLLTQAGWEVFAQKITHRTGAVKSRTCLSR